MRRPVHRLWLLAAALIAVAVAVAGCGVADPYNHHASAGSARTSASTPTSESSSTDPSEPAHPSGTPAANSPVTGAGGGVLAGSARAALAHYARLYVNWTAQTLGARQRQLAELSEGQARARALQAAASYARDRLLQDSHAANSGQVVAVAAGQGVERGWWVIVTRERTTGQGQYAGLPAAAHVIYAQLVRSTGGWLVSQWSPQS